MPENAIPDQEILNHSANDTASTETINPITPKEILLLANKKAPGPDLITPKMIKELPKKAIVLLTYIFNAVLRLHYWPNQLKIA
jgi:hypothetical protein